MYKLLVITKYSDLNVSTVIADFGSITAANFAFDAIHQSEGGKLTNIYIDAIKLYKE